jgi:molybdenum transport protein
VIQLSDGELDRWLDEDLPYLDLTTHLLGIGDLPATATFAVREPGTVAACTEEAARLLSRCGAGSVTCLATGALAGRGTVLVAAEGSAAALHGAWKVAQNLLEYACGVATRTRLMVEAAGAVAPGIRLLTTRKTTPGTRKMAIKAIIAGGALPHRLGLSESILVFENHLALMSPGEALRHLRSRVPDGLESRFTVEVSGVDAARIVASQGFKSIQFDKLPPDRLAALTPLLRGEFPGIEILAAGGITPANVSAYAATGVDALVTSSPYHGPPADIEVRIEGRDPLG